MGVKIIKFIDKYIGAPLCISVGLLSRLFPKKEYNTKKILLIQLWGIGETILTLPAVKALRKKFPESNFSLLCTRRNRDIYLKNNDIDDLVTIELNPASILIFILKNYKKYDLVIDFEEYLNISALIAFFTGRFRIGFSAQIRSLLYNKKIRYNDKQHVVQTHLDLVRLLGADLKFVKLIRLHYSKKDKKYVERLLKKLNINNNNFIIGFGAGAAESAKSRMWPKGNFAELAIALIKRFNKRDPKLLFFGAHDEKELVEEIINLIKTKNKKSANNIFNLAGELSLRQAFVLIERCNLFISNDTGLMHIAAAQGVKTIGLFGPNIPLRWGPYGKENHYIYKGKVCKYSPCINVHKGRIPECRFGDDNICMKAIKVNDIIKLLKQFLAF